MLLRLRRNWLALAFSAIDDELHGECSSAELLLLCFSPPINSRHNIPHHLARDICEPEIAACVTVGEPLVIKAQQMQHRRV